MTGKRLGGSVLPTAVAATVIIAVGMMCLIGVWEREHLALLRLERVRQASADAGSAYLLYRLHPDDERLTAQDGFRLYDSLPRSGVRIAARPWGLYEIVTVTTADYLARLCRIVGAEPDAECTLYYADGGTALNVAGGTRLRGMSYLPEKGLVYGRMGAEPYNGGPVPASAVGRSGAALPEPDKQAVARLRHLLTRNAVAGEFVGNRHNPFSADTTLFMPAGSADMAGCSLSGRIVLSGDEIRIDSACRMSGIIVCARKVTVCSGARITAQILVRDTAVVGPRAVLAYPSGIYAQGYAELGGGAAVDGYVIVCDTARRERPSACYRQAPDARLRGLLYVDGMAEVRGCVTGFACLRSAVYFSPQGYYKDMLYDVELRENPVTAHPLWIADTGVRRKEAACAD